MSPAIDLNALQLFDQNRPYEEYPYPKELGLDNFWLGNHVRIVSRGGQEQAANDQLLDIEWKLPEAQHRAETIASSDLLEEQEIYQKLLRIVTDSSLSAKIERISQELNLSKTALAQIMGVSRQAIYDWLGEKTVDAKEENLEKLEWLSQLSAHLSGDIKESMWMWKSRTLPQTGLTIEQSILEGKIDPANLANYIRLSAAEWAARPAISVWKQKGDKELLNETSPPMDRNA